MTKNHCSFQQLPFSSLFTTYISDFEKLSGFYSVNPFNDQKIEEKAFSLTQPEHKLDFAKALKLYHDHLGIAESQSQALNKFSEPESIAIVTGQQLGVFGGPLFTVYKTITTVLLARKWEKKLGHPVIPVFWLADEDHDFEEIASLGIPDYDKLKQIMLKEEGTGQPVSDQVLSGSVTDFVEAVKENLHNSDFTESVFAKLSQSYSKGKTHAQAFAQLMNDWFAEEGLLIAGSNFAPVKNLCADVLIKSITAADEIHEALEGQSAKIEQTYHRQVVVGESNLFYVHSEEGRLKLERAEEGWRAGDITLGQEKLVSLIEANPAKFSPNVFLRPVLQDKLLPTLGYVAGPGELAYYAQMKKLYEVFDLEMPVIFPRLSITLIESSIERIMNKLPFEMCSYNQRIEDLEAAYIDHSNSKDVDGVFEKWNNELQNIAKEPTAFIKEIDPTLEGTAGKVVTGFSNELDKLKGKVYRSIKHQEQTQLNRIAKIKSQLFPDSLQERAVSPVYFMNKYGYDIWIKLLNDFEKSELDLTRHHLISI